jgi:hypothetical protein
LQDGYSFSKNNCYSIYLDNRIDDHALNWISIVVIHMFITQMPKDNDSTTYLWHCRLGHIGVKRKKKLHADGLLKSLVYESFETCKPCLMGKMTKTLFSRTMEWATNLLEIIHTDVCGPMSVEARGGYHYVLTFTDVLRRYEYIYLMKHKSETFEKFKEFQSEVENHCNKKIKFLWFDRRREYLIYKFGT